ncbi:MAG: hypothetical protein F4Y76_12675, partial [Acidimicrobiales bacterium]|nr:hypothetical protein [Acidimicrobiales bacterium]MYG62675.1 hypothetical protein [Acidimicrobiales bacterium]
MSVPSLRERRFELQLQPTKSGDDWGFRLSETFESTAEAVANVDAARAPQFRRAVLEAVEASGYPTAAVSPRRCRPFNLAQRPGVRLALTVSASLPVARPLRRRAIVDGVEALSPEEALYWYA